MTTYDTVNRSTLRMRYSSLARRAGAAALLILASCQSLDVTNPNSPDARRALSDPSVITALAGGTLRTFFNTYNGLDGVGALVTQARSHTASWNNFNMNFYSSVDTTTDASEANSNRNSRAWVNDPASGRRTNMEHYWEGYYAAASAASDVLFAIRVNNVDFGSATTRARAEAVAELMLGAALGQLAITYDKGYAIDENTDLLALAYVDRAVMRDTAIVKLTSAAAIANATAFTLPNSWTGLGNDDPPYTNVDIARLANTLAAMTLAYWPRDAAENNAVNWAQVAAFAANGLTSDFTFVGDGCAVFCPEMQSWSNDIWSIRVHTRVAALLDPATQTHPYPVGGNPQPNSADQRLGDGSFGADSIEADYGTVARTGNEGTDFAWSSYEAFFPSRGQYHQSNIIHIRYDLNQDQAQSGIWGAYGPVPLIPRAQNDLIHAEALIRSGGSLATAATLINNTRVTRGGLTAAAGGEGAPTLLGYVDYENEIELLSLGASTFFNRRRAVNGLIVGTPREMPVPAKELGVKLEALYTWGGTGAANSPTPP